MKCTNAIQQKDELSRRNGHPGREASGIHTSRVGACLIASLIALLLSACGDSGTTEDVTRVTQSMEVVTDVSQLPKCEKGNDGELVWVKGEATPRMCSDGKWYAVAEGSVQRPARRSRCLMVAA